MTNEIWKDIAGYEGMYQISNLGNIKTLQRYVKNGKKTVKLHKEKLLIPGENELGYKSIGLHKDGIVKYVKVHKLVWMAFGCAERTSDLVIDHINNNHQDNRAENLQLLTPRQNSTKAALTRKNKTSKYTGVSKNCESGKWQAFIRIKGKNKNLGSYGCELTASLAYQTALNNLVGA